MNQLDMPLSREPSHAAIAVELVRAQKTSAAAFTLACSVSGLDDKEIYLSLDIDAGYFSNIKKGKATLQADKAAEFCRVVGNTVYMEWLAYQLGCTLVMIKSEAERRAEAAEARAADAERKLAWAQDLLRGRVTA